MPLEVRRVIDLSHRVDEDTQVYPGDPAVRLEPATTIAADGVNVLNVHIGSHSGTHVDAPYHFVENGERIDTMDVRLFFGRAVVMDVRGKGPRERITVEDLRPTKADSRRSSLPSCAPAGTSITGRPVTTITHSSTAGRLNLWWTPG
jgi:kynurenine formamidase